MKFWIFASFLTAYALLAHKAPALAASEATAPNAGNPILPAYFADPSIHKFGSTYYIYGTTDGNSWRGGAPGVWMSEDLAHWRFEKMTFDVSIDTFWAASALFHHGKYFLYYSKTFSPGTYVAESDLPTGPWTEKALLAADDIDAQPFLDDDGRLYLYYGGIKFPKVVRLNDDAISFAESPSPLILPSFEEGSFMLKRGGIYYLMYSNGDCSNDSYNLRYVTSRSPYGPFVDGPNNPILSTTSDGSIHGPGHHSVLEEKGTYYVIYHRHDNPHAADGLRRQVAIDEMNFDADGGIKRMAPTHEGPAIIRQNSQLEQNLAAGKSVVASSIFSVNYSPAAALDNNNGTRWTAATASKPQWLQIDLGDIKEIGRVELSFEYAERWVRYHIEASIDGQNWTLFADHKNATQSFSPYTDVKNTKARYIKLLITETEREEDFASIWELKVFGPTSTSNNRLNSRAP